MAIREDIRSQLPEDAIVFDNPSYDNAIVGVTTDGKVVYNYNKMIDELIYDTFYNMSFEEAQEFIEYNTMRALPCMGDMAPIIYEDLVV